MNVVRIILIQMLVVVFIIELSGLFIFKSRTFLWRSIPLDYADNYRGWRRVVDLQTWKLDTRWHFILGETSTTVEYDCTLRQTKKVSVSSAKSVENNFDYVFLGARFCRGEGGCPWMDDELTQTDYCYNAGLKGIGGKYCTRLWALTQSWFIFQEYHSSCRRRIFRTPSSQFYFDILIVFKTQTAILVILSGF